MARVYLLIALAYLSALAVGLVVAAAMGGLHPLLVLAAADLAATAVVFLWSVRLNNSSVYDPYWSVAPICFVLFWWAQPDAAGEPARQLLVALLVALWGVRLTANWAARWRGLGDEDWRYVDIRSYAGRWYWPASFLAIHLLPTVVVFLGSLALWPALTAPAPLGWLDLAAAVVTAVATLVEAAADLQLRRYLRAGPPRGQTLQSGLWAWSRHPNYFGEVLFWWGLWLFAMAAAPALWWTVAGPLAMTALFLGVSIPMIDRRMRARRPDYAGYAARVSPLVPWPPRPAVSEEGPLAAGELGGPQA